MSNYSTPYFSDWLKRKVGQVVLVVVDALRADFVFSESFLAKNGIKDKIVDVERPKITVLTDWIEKSNSNVKAFVARANAPTVTMPRVKVQYLKFNREFLKTVLHLISKS